MREKARADGDALPALERLKERLRLGKLPRRMECFDVSHFQGAALVASKVAMIDGEPDKAGYRRFKVKSVAGQDDFKSIYEVVARRLKRGVAERDLPDLMIIDGGKGQLAAARAALKDAGAPGVEVVALAKERGGAADRVFVSGQREPVPLGAPEMRLLLRLRDEAHRFAVGYHRTLMRKIFR